MNNDDTVSAFFTEEDSAVQSPEKKNQMKRQISSITQQVRFSTRSITIIMILPVILGLAVMLLFAFSYQRMLRRLTMASELKPVVESQIPEELFSVAAGRIRFEESSVEVSVALVNERIEALLRESRGEGQLQLTVADRTMGTLEEYVHQVRDGRESGEPVARVEAIVDEVRDVGALVSDMLEEFIAAEIEQSGRTNAKLRLVLILSALGEAILLALALWNTRNATNRLSESIHSSIRRLERIVRRLAAGNLQDRVTSMDVEELQELADQINIMADRLEALIEQNKREQVNLAKSELRTLQAQIHPHFLYNTLDAIVWQAESGKAEEVIRLTRSLSDFFRISLSHGADWIPAEQEIQHVNAYLSIQKIRYRDILNYEVVNEIEDSREIYMVKLLLQPLVENALYHGIKNRRGGGTIRVLAAREGDDLVFRVEDNGRGMDPDALERVRASLGGDTPPVIADAGEGGFGLRNVDMRIRLYYQQKEGLDIQSDSRGTVVSFRIPCRLKEEIVHDEGIPG